MRFLAIDWGTTNRRIFLIEDGRVVESGRDDRGAACLSAGDYPAEVAGIRARFGDLPVLIAGMAGSTIGWRSVSYARPPAGLAALAAGIERVGDRIAIVPGVATVADGRADVMRGEEVQLLGAASAGMVPPDALLCQPGTHCKWARLEGGEIASFVTAMTGELFALLRTHGLLARQLGGVVADGPAFRAGVAEGARGDLAASLFGIRARSVLGVADDADAAAFASGLLIGGDVAARIAPGDAVDILADPHLGALYTAAVAEIGGSARLIDSHAAFVAGITRLMELVA